MEAQQEHAANTCAAKAAKTFRKAAEAPNLRKQKRKTEPVGKPNLYEVGDSTECDSAAESYASSTSLRLRAKQ